MRPSDVFGYIYIYIYVYVCVYIYVCINENKIAPQWCLKVCVGKCLPGYNDLSLCRSSTPIYKEQRTKSALAIIVANPTDLVKVRLQAEGKLPAGVPKRYTGSLDAYSTIVRQEGLGALWTGLGPNVARNAIINAAELASYDQVKETILKIPGSIDNILTHLLAGLGADFFAVSIGSPVDVVKSRMMGDSTYKNTFDCFVKTLKHEGFLAFYKGFLPNFGRLGSWNVVMFLVLEQAKNVFRV
ncbi:unnamed protein product [Malus baccata var. baccata]